MSTNSIFKAEGKNDLEPLTPPLFNRQMKIFGCGTAKKTGSRPILNMLSFQGGIPPPPQKMLVFLLSLLR